MRSHWIVAGLVSLPVTLSAQQAALPSFAPPAASPADSAVYRQALEFADRRQDAAAIALLRPLAEKGHPQAGLLLGEMHANGWGVPLNRIEALGWVRRTAEAASPRGQSFIAFHFLYEQDFPGYDEHEALRWLRAAADRGDAAGALGLGIMYKHGRGVERSETQAAHWFHRAAALGLAPAELMLATLYADPAGELHDPVEAERRFASAISAGGPDLLFAWAEAYEGGPAHYYPVPLDPEEAARLHRRAARLGHGGARLSLERLQR